MSSVRTMNKIHRLLIANRGEIAVRIMKTARQLGIETIAVYSDADRYSRHTKLADKAYHIGSASALESYLCIDKIIDVATKSHCQAIHPGYGFLSENADLADQCDKENLIFIGPPSEAIRSMGAKSLSKQIMSDAGVPIIAGYHGSERSTDRLLNEASKIGYPVMLKAVHGGGGKGMRIAWNESEFEEKLMSARSEAKTSFGNDSMIIEKFVERPRHVEVQIFGDHFGNYVYLWERDCSIQRRHQKIIEEAPAPGIDTETRKRLGTTAVRAARAVSYCGAGTVEFIMNAQMEFFFMEMNTRLQVEHTVSEAITNTDLVEWQLRVAEGERLPILQSDIVLNGHAIEARVYAEDTSCGFIPSAGVLEHVLFPSGVRVDTAIGTGDEVSVHYDPMIAKIIVWDENRDKAIKRLDKALRYTHISGLPTNISFVRAILNHKNFIDGMLNTEFIAEHENDLFMKKKPSKKDLCEVIVTKVLFNHVNVSRSHDLFIQNDYFRLNHSAKIGIIIDDDIYQVKVVKKDEMIVEIGDEKFDVSIEAVNRVDPAIEFLVNIDGEKRRVKAVVANQRITVFGSEHWTYTVPGPYLNEDGVHDTSDMDARAPMPGIIEKVLVQGGDSTLLGHPLVIMVAMKMEYIIRASRDGVIDSVSCKVGDNVSKNAVLVKFCTE